MILTESLLVAFVDGELDDATARQVEDMIACDPVARRKVEVFRQTASLLRSACGQAFYSGNAMPPALRRARRTTPRGRLHGWALAASILLTAALGFGGGTMLQRGHESERSELLEEIAEYHPIYASETAHLVEVPATQGDELSAWLGERLGRRLQPPDLSAAGLHFAGGRMLVVGGRPVAQLMYTREGGSPVGLCVTRLPGERWDGDVERHGNMRLVSWGDGSFAYVVVGDLGESAAREIAKRAEAQLRI
jgi:anti-sigma factor RsiW